MGLIGQIAQEACENGEMAQKHPIDLWLVFLYI
jgi:hypothetical protein